MKILIALAFIGFSFQVSAKEVRFIDLPIALQIISVECESGGIHYNKNETVLKSPTSDYGIMQINRIHKEDAKKLGYDIMTPSGNMGWALYLYKKNGLRDWRYSKSCWGAKVAKNKQDSRLST